MSTQVLIVGAGPVGLTLALDLARRGVRFRIIDKSEGPAAESRALAIHPRTLEILEQLGLKDEVHAEGRILRGARFMAGKDELAHIHFDKLDTPFPYTVTLEQSRTEKLLAARLADLGIAVERNTALIGLTQVESGVRAAVENEGRAAVIEAEYLVGCDGARSAVRGRLGLDFEGITADERYLLVDCQAEFGHAYPEDEMTAFLGDRSRLLFGALRTPLWRVIITLPNDDPRMPSGSPTLHGIQEIIDADHAEAGLRLHDAVWLSAFKVNTRMVDRFRVGRCFVAGDAAHIHSPSGGQGMNTGMQDAFNLGWKLAAALSGTTASQALLDSYEAERKPIAAKVLRATRLVDYFITGHRKKFFRSVRDGVLPLLTGLELIQDLVPRALSGGEVNYRGSPIVETHLPGLGEWLSGQPDAARIPLRDIVGFAHGAQAGDVAPDARGIALGAAGPARLYEHFSQDVRGRALLVAGPDASDRVVEDLQRQSARLREAAGDTIRVMEILPRGRSRDNAYIDQDGELARRYGATEAGLLVLVRPDGYVGFRSEPIEVQAFLEHLRDPGALMRRDHRRDVTPLSGGFASQPVGNVQTYALAGVYALLGAAKLSGADAFARNFDHWGFPRGTIYAVGAAEAAGAVSLVVPALRPYAAVGLLGLLGGAVATHLANREARNAIPALALFVGTSSLLLGRPRFGKRHTHSRRSLNTSA